MLTSTTSRLTPEHYKVLFEHSPVPMLTVECDSCRILTANVAACRLYGYDVDRLLELNLEVLFDPEDWPQALHALAATLREQPDRGRWRQRGPHGNMIHVDMDIAQMELKGVSACLLLMHDVSSECRRVQDNERISQELDLLNTVVNASYDAIISVNMEGEIQTFNPGAERIFDVRSVDMRGQNIETLLPERFRKAHLGFRTAFARSKCPEGRMMGLRLVKGLRSDGVEIDLEGTIANMPIAGQPVLIATMRDVTRSLAVEDQQKSMRKQLSQLTHRLMSQEKDLLKRIALALHDQLGQTMAAIRIVYETVLTLRKQGRMSELSRLENQLGGLIEQAIRQVRVVVSDLQPPMLEEHGLATALDNELRNRVRSQSAMQLILQAPPEVASIRWPADVEHAVFMIAREAVENAIRHSGGSQLTMVLAGGSSELTLDVWDNGCGLPSKPEVPNEHLGLISITERADAIGAHVTLDSGAKGGVHLSLHWEATP